jgi:hypothetical protein
MKIFLLQISSIFLLLMPFSYVFAQWDCRSILAPNLRQISDSSFLKFGVEAMGAYGVFDERIVGNGFLIGGLSMILTENQELYFEGGYKGWSVIKEGFAAQREGNKQLSKHLGFREISYKLTEKDFKFSLGLFPAKLGDFFLVDERSLGTSMKFFLGKWTFTATAATVEDWFARMGDFCGTRKLFYMAKGTKAGENLFETNYAGAVLAYHPGIGETCDTGEDQFEDFITVDNSIKLNTIGVLFYNEFGKHNIPAFYYGALADFELPADLGLQIELVMQDKPKNKNVLGQITLRKDFTYWNGFNTQLQVQYYGKVNIDEGARFSSSFSNIYLSEAMRMDVMDFPLLAGVITQHFPWVLSPYIKFRAVQQLDYDRISEYDLELAVNFDNYIKITSVIGYIQSNILKIYSNVYRIETRFGI